MSILFNKKIIILTSILISIFFITGIFGIVHAENDDPLDQTNGEISDEFIERLQGGGTVTPEEEEGLKDAADLEKKATASQTEAIEGYDDDINITAKEKALQDQQRIQSARREARSDFTALNPIPGVIDEAAAKDPSKFFNGMFMFGISIAAFLAVLMIAVGGIQYMSTDAVSGKSEGKERITYAVMGLLLVLFSWILLRQINPEILNFDFLNTSSSSVSNTKTIIGESGSGGRASGTFTEYSDEDIYVGTDERGFYRVVGEDKDGNEVRFYPDLQVESNNGSESGIQSSVNLPVTADDKIRELEGFIESGSLSDEEIKAAQDVIDALKNQ